MEILLQRILNLSDDEIKKAKVRFIQESSSTQDPMELYKANPDIVNSEWLFWHKKSRYFRIENLAICLLRLSEDEWLLTTIKEVTKILNVVDEVEGGIGYEGVEIEKFAEYYGRVVVKYPKDHQTQGVLYSNVKDKLEVLKILPSVYDGEDFPGYDKVRLSFQQLETIINRGKGSWKNALENQKAVYLITDKSNGKLYVGSATGEDEMLLERWRAYIKNGHGKNEELKEFDFEYIKNNFQYSILENYNARVDKKIIRSREIWWKKTLQTIHPFGYNKNY
ncbi:MAG: GIY-YIG nuclease family protein [Christensenellaceae bacterium]|nr:GIY-YIG nuclease family protein [Christensenellaceae bacterium]